jgi:DNA-binding MarR family transcriptional regulator
MISSESEHSGEEVLRVLRRIIRAIDLQSKQLVLEHGLTVPQWMLLDALRAAPRTPSDLAQRLHLNASTVNNIAVRLEQQGLLHRRRDEADRRRVWVELSPEGAVRLAAAPAPLQQRFFVGYARLEAPQRRSLLAALQLTAELLDAGRIDAAPMLAIGDLAAEG